MQIKVFKRQKAILLNQIGVPCEAISNSSNDTNSVRRLNEWIKKQKKAHSDAEVVEC